MRLLFLYAFICVRCGLCLSRCGLWLLRCAFRLRRCGMYLSRCALLHLRCGPSKFTQKKPFPKRNGFIYLLRPGHSTTSSIVGYLIFRAFFFFFNFTEAVFNRCRNQSKSCTENSSCSHFYRLVTK